MNLDQTAQIGFTADDETVVLIGETAGHLGSSLYLRDVLGPEDGAPPPVDLAAERNNGDFVRAAIRDRRVTACHDLSDGGLLLGLAEMALVSDIGCTLEPGPEGLPAHAWLFGEDQARYLVAVDGDPRTLLDAARSGGIVARVVARTGGDALTVPGERPISLNDMRQVHEGWLPGYMAGGAWTRQQERGTCHGHEVPAKSSR